MIFKYRVISRWVSLHCFFKRYFFLVCMLLSQNDQFFLWCFFIHVSYKISFSKNWLLGRNDVIFPNFTCKMLGTTMNGYHMQVIQEAISWLTVMRMVRGLTWNRNCPGWKEQDPWETIKTMSGQQKNSSCHRRESLAMSILTNMDIPWTYIHSMNIHTTLFWGANTSGI